MDPAARFAASLNNPGDRQAYLDAASQLLLKLFPSDHAVWNSLDAQTGTAEVVPCPYHSCDNVPEMLVDMHRGHPILASLQTDTVVAGLRPLLLSDFISDLELYKTRAFQEGSRSSA